LDAEIPSGRVYGLVPIPFPDIGIAVFVDGYKSLNGIEIERVRTDAYDRACWMALVQTTRITVKGRKGCGIQYHISYALL